MVPTEFVARAIPVAPDSRTQSFHFGDERLSIESHEIFIHASTLHPQHHLPEIAHSSRRKYGESVYSGWRHEQLEREVHSLLAAHGRAEYARLQ
jgi:hypothetical protein